MQSLRNIVSLSEDGKWIFDQQKGEWVPTAPDIENQSSPDEPTHPAIEPQVPPTKVSAPKTASGGKKMAKVDLNKTLSQSIIAVIMGLGFLMLIVSESYSYSSNYTPGPEAPDTVSSSDFDLDGNGLNATEQLNYDYALDQYNDAYAEYLEDVEDHNTLMSIYEGKAAFWNNLAPGFIVAGLVCLTFQSKAVTMTNSIRLTLLIGTLYLVANMLGFDMPGVAGDVSFGLGS